MGALLFILGTLHCLYPLLRAQGTCHDHFNREDGGHHHRECSSYSPYLAHEDTEDEEELFQRGHMKPLGYHRPPDRLTEEIPYMIAPEDFHQHFVSRHRPLIIRNSVRHWNATWRWTDEYLASQFGQADVKVETKDDNRYKSASKMTFAEFLSSYKEKRDWYLVDELLPEMREDVILPTCLRCEEMTDRFFVSYLWLSNGGTSSVIHVDTDENLLCVLHGAKTLLLVSPLYSHQVHADESGILGVSGIDPLAVDFEQFPLAKNIRYELAQVYAGDLIYIPQFWWHHVISHSGRQQAVALWWKSKPIGKSPGGQDSKLGGSSNEYSFAKSLVFYEQWVLNASHMAPRLKCNMQTVRMSEFLWETDNKPGGLQTKEYGYDEEDKRSQWDEVQENEDGLEVLISCASLKYFGLNVQVFCISGLHENV